MRCKSGQNEKQYHEDCYIDNFFTAICPWVYISAIFYCTIFGMYGSNRLNTKKKYGVYRNCFNSVTVFLNISRSFKFSV